MKRAEKHMMCKKELRTVNIASPDQIKQSSSRSCGHIVCSPGCGMTNHCVCMRFLGILAGIISIFFVCGFENLDGNSVCETKKTEVSAKNTSVVSMLSL